MSITKDIRISDILTHYPNQARALTRIMTDFGIHCVGCGAATHETLEQGVLGHGFSKKDLSSLLEQLNQAVDSVEPVAVAAPAAIEDFTLTLSPSAAQKVKEIMTQHGNPDAVLRVEVLAGGCSGFKYELNILDHAFATDWQGRQGDVNIAVDQTGLDKLNGMEIDYVDTLNESGFKFNNPNAKQGCGCGKSFR